MSIIQIYMYIFIINIIFLSYIKHGFQFVDRNVKQ